MAKASDDDPVLIQPSAVMVSGERLAGCGDAFFERLLGGPFERYQVEDVDGDWWLIQRKNPDESQK